MEPMIAQIKTAATILSFPSQVFASSILNQKMRIDIPAAKNQKNKLIAQEIIFLVYLVHNEE